MCLSLPLYCATHIESPGWRFILIKVFMSVVWNSCSYVHWNGMEWFGTSWIKAPLLKKIVPDNLCLLLWSVHTALAFNSHLRSSYFLECLWIESLNPPLWFVSDKSFLFGNIQEAYGVMRNGEHAYPLSPRMIPSSRELWFSSRNWPIFDDRKMWLSWQLPGHLATILIL